MVELIIAVMIGALIGVFTVALVTANGRAEERSVAKVMLDDYVRMPTKAHRTDGGWDIYSPVEVTIEAGKSVFIDSGVHIELPYGTVGMIKSKSGLNVKHGITSEGVIDVGYTGSIGIKLYNHSDKDYTVKKGDKITQLVIMPINMLDLELTDRLEATERGTGGFGSTGR